MKVNKNWYLKTVQAVERPTYRYWVFVHNNNPRKVEIVRQKKDSSGFITVTGKEEFQKFLKARGDFQVQNFYHWDSSKNKEYRELVDRSQSEHTISKKGTVNNNIGD